MRLGLCLGCDLVWPLCLWIDSSEYLAACDERRAFISGFNGSAGE